MNARKWRVPRVWSNKELRKFAHLMQGKILNVSGWQDNDKEGKRYKDYFVKASEYWITNFEKEARGFQGNLENEIFLDLSLPLSQNSFLFNKFDVVLNHTVLEHIFEVDLAFANLCKLTRDLVIIVVPFLQEEHSEYGDFWRFTPQAIDKLFKKNGLVSLYLNYNDSCDSSIYIFAIGSKNPGAWREIFSHPSNKVAIVYSKRTYLGAKIIRSSVFERIVEILFSLAKKIKNKTLHLFRK